MWKSGKSPTVPVTFFPQGVVDKFQVINRGNVGKKQVTIFHRNFLHNFTTCGEILQAGIDIGSDVLNVVLQGGVPGLQCLFHLIDGI